MNRVKDIKRNKSIRVGRDGIRRMPVTVYLDLDVYGKYVDRATDLGPPWTPSTLMTTILNDESESFKTSKARLRERVAA